MIAIPQPLLPSSLKLPSQKNPYRFPCCGASFLLGSCFFPVLQCRPSGLLPDHVPCRCASRSCRCWRSAWLHLFSTMSARSSESSQWCPCTLVLGQILHRSTCKPHYCLTTAAVGPSSCVRTVLRARPKFPGVFFVSTFLLYFLCSVGHTTTSSSSIDTLSSETQPPHFPFHCRPTPWRVTNFLQRFRTEKAISSSFKCSLP